MTNRYDDDETERVRERERSSAGRDTQALRLPSEPLPLDQSYQRVVAAPPQRLPLLGIALFFVGLISLVIVLGSRAFGEIDWEPMAPLGSVAAGLLFFAFYKRIYGLLIPGCIMAGLSMGVPLAELTNGASVVWSLSAAFLSVFVIGRAAFQQYNDWPLIPAVILFLVGVIVISSSFGGFMATIALWPCIALVALGVWLSRRRG